MSAFYTSAFFAVVLTLGAYAVGMAVQRKIRIALFHPLVISTVLVILVLGLTGIGYERYFEGASWISALLGPATVALAVPLNRQFDLLVRNKTAILVGIAAGTAASLTSVVLLSLATALPQDLLLSLLPKSITTAIGVEMSTRIGGIPSITSASIVFTGIEGAVLARPLARLFRITDPVAHGLAIGASSHAIGTARAIEISELTGAISSLAIVLSGLLTVLLIPLLLPLLS
jgi:predicted murein hydrolase (TIGR00659 family)